MSFLFRGKAKITESECNIRPIYLYFSFFPLLDLKQEEKCNNDYDDWLFCQQHYGFNDLKCKSIVFPHVPPTN